MDLLERLKQQQSLAMQDYAGLLNAYPNATRFGSGLLKAIDSHIPKSEDYDIKNNPKAMQEWSMSVFENGPGAISRNFLPRAFDPAINKLPTSMMMFQDINGPIR